jgi:hypothetical protein
VSIPRRHLDIPALEDKGTIMMQNAGIRLPNNTASYIRSMESPGFIYFGFSVLN